MTETGARVYWQDANESSARISTDRKKYPFYEPYIVKTNLIPDSIIEIHPSTQYDDDLFIWIEDFEDPQHKFNSFNFF